jgi:hypothetical protein
VITGLDLEQRLLAGKSKSLVGALPQGMPGRPPPHSVHSMRRLPRPPYQSGLLLTGLLQVCSSHGCQT